MIDRAWIRLRKDILSSRSNKKAGNIFRRLVSSMTMLGLVSTGGCVQKNEPGKETVGETVDEAINVIPDISFQDARSRLVQGLRAKGIKNELVLNAILSVPRHEFVPDELKAQSYDDNPLPIGAGQTISQPFIVAYMTESLGLKSSDRVLEIGTGSGYQAAVLSRLAKEVYSVEIISEFALQAKSVFSRLGITNVHVLTGDGYKGWPQEAPYDAIIITAAPKEIPEQLVSQLKPGGRLIAPVGDGGVQWLVRVVKKDDRTTKETLLPVRFVPMVHERAPGGLYR